MSVGNTNSTYISLESSEWEQYTAVGLFQQVNLAIVITMYRSIYTEVLWDAYIYK